MIYMIFDRWSHHQLSDSHAAGVENGLWPDPKHNCETKLDLKMVQPDRMTLGVPSCAYERSDGLSSCCKAR